MFNKAWASPAGARNERERERLYSALRRPKVQLFPNKALSPAPETPIAKLRQQLAAKNAQVKELKITPDLASQGRVARETDVIAGTEGAVDEKSAAKFLCAAHLGRMSLFTNSMMKKFDGSSLGNLQGEALVSLVAGSKQSQVVLSLWEHVEA